VPHFSDGLRGAHALALDGATSASTAIPREMKSLNFVDFPVIPKDFFWEIEGI
jgi:hypothetical protein